MGNYLANLLQFLTSERLKLKVLLWLVSFYLVRTVFPLYKYLFVLFLGALLLLVVFDLKVIKRINVKYFLLPGIVYLIFFFEFIFTGLERSQLLKEVINGFIIFILFYLFIFTKISIQKELLRKIVFLILIVGIIAVIRYPLTFIGIPIPLSNILFASPGFTIVSDINFYALYFLIAIIIFHFDRENGFKNNFLIEFFVYSILILNIFLSFSFRGYLIFILVIIFSLVQLFLSNRKRIIAFLLANIFLILVGFTIWLIFSYQFYDFDKKKNVLPYGVYKVYGIFNKDVDRSNYKNWFWKNTKDRYWRKKQIDKNNLLYNGDFSQGLTYWYKYEGKFPNSITQEVVETKDGHAIKIERTNGSGYWSLIYGGREIYFHKDQLYTLVFEVNTFGEKLPFKVGWWIKENGTHKNSLPVLIDSLDSNWVSCRVEHVFKEDQLNPIFFLNSQKANSKILIRNINLSCDTLIQPIYLDNNDSLYVLPDNQSGISTASKHAISRLERWIYAFEIFNNYDMLNKLFGHGFDYLQWYGKKFLNNSKRYDYPHNPIISTFLYSGIIGGLFYIYFLIMVFWYYWKYRKHHMIFFLMYLVTFFFMMFSGNSHFSVPIFTFLSLIPFLTKYYIESGKINNKQNAISNNSHNCNLQ